MTAPFTAPARSAGVVLALLALLALLAAPLRAQSEFGLLGGFATAPYDYDDGWVYAGFLDVPLIATEGTGVLQGQVLVGHAASDDNQETLTTALFGTQDVSTDQREFFALLGLKYRLDVHERFRPYAVLGPGMVVNLNSPSPLVAGQVPVAPELAARGIPTGQGFMLAALHAGAGLQVQLAPEVSLGGEARFVIQENSSSNFTLVTGRFGFHF